ASPPLKNIDHGIGSWVRLETCFGSFHRIEKVPSRVGLFSGPKRADIVIRVSPSTIHRSVCVVLSTHTTRPFRQAGSIPSAAAAGRAVGTSQAAVRAGTVATAANRRRRFTEPPAKLSFLVTGGSYPRKVLAIECARPVAVRGCGATSGPVGTRSEGGTAP